MTISIVWLFLVVLLTGCTSLSSSRPHINLNKVGYLVTDDGTEIKGKATVSQINSFLDKIGSQVKGELAAKRKAKILVYIHGGMNSRRSALESFSLDR